MNIEISLSYTYTHTHTHTHTQTLIRNQRAIKSFGGQTITQMHTYVNEVIALLIV
jgi:hypothetical protein